MNAESDFLYRISGIIKYLFELLVFEILRDLPTAISNSANTTLFFTLGYVEAMIGVLLYKPAAVRSHLPPHPRSSVSPTHTSSLAIHPPCKPSSMDSNTNAKIRKEQLMALPSVSCSLSQLPQARSMAQVSLHPSSMSAQLAAESEAKVRFILNPARDVRAYLLRNSSAKYSQNRMLRPTHH